MRTKCLSALLLLLSFGVATADENMQKPTATYGEATVLSVLRLDEHVRLYCDIADFPAVIGQNIPVCIESLKPAETAQDNLKLLMFLNDLFLSKNTQPKEIILKNIRRGERFCLIADIHVDGQNLCDLLIEKGLARKVVEVPQQPRQENTTGMQGTATDRIKETSPSSPLVDGECIASKSSKVFHRGSCSHVKRMDAAKAVSFSSRESAAKTGRRPCKTCQP